LADRRFYFWESYGKAFDMLTDEEAGRFIRACYRFAFDGVDPEFSDEPKLGFAWQIVSGQIERSVDIGVKNAERGRRGGRPKKSGAKTTAKSGAKSGAESDMNMNMNVGAAASLNGSAAAPIEDGGDSDEY
jgi:hypothetical protein